MTDSHQEHQLRQEPLRPGQFFGDVRRAGSLAGVTLSEIEHRHARRMPEHGHAAAYFSLLLAGSYRERLGRRREFRYERSAIVYHPAGMCHRDEIGPAGGRLFIVELAPAWQERIDSLNGGRHALAQPVCLRGGPVPALGLRLYRELHRADDCSPLVVEGLMLEMLGETARSGGRRQPPPAWLPRVLDCLREELEVNWTLGALGRATGVDPAELSRAFRRHRGETLGQHLRRQRVALVCERLAAEPDASLAGVAAEAGFADQSHLTRVFRRLTGTTPGAFQAALRQGRREARAAIGPRVRRG